VYDPYSVYSNKPISETAEASMIAKKNSRKAKKIIYSLALIPLLIILFLFGWFFTILFEGEKPAVLLEPLPEFLSKGQVFTVSMRDAKRGLKTFKVSVNQGGREITILEEQGIVESSGRP